MISGLTKLLYSIASVGVFRAQPSQTQPSGMELFAETVNGLRRWLFPQKPFLQCLFESSISLWHLWRNSLNPFCFYFLLTTTVQIGDGTINLIKWFISFFYIFITDFLQIVVWKIEQSIWCFKSQILHLNINITTLNWPPMTTTVFPLISERPQVIAAL